MVGLLTQVKTSTGIDTVYMYTSRGQIKSISDRGLSSANDATGTVSYGYDEFGRKESITRPNGTTSEYAYDPLTGWTESITHKRGGTVLLALGYDRDKTGLITDIAETRPAGEQSGAWHYGYDKLKRLSGATWTPSTGAATEYGYTYDRNGNRLSESVTGSATKYSRYNKLDQLLDERSSAAYPGGTIEKSYAWDKHGRLASEMASIASASRVYTWSVDDRLESVRLGPNTSDPTVRYTYDHEGRLIKREKGQDVARFLVDNDNPTGYSQALAEVNADATKTTENYYYGDDFGPLAQVHNPGASGFDQRFLYGDHLSTTRLLDSALASDSYHYYTPFGNQTGPSTPLSAFAFTGQYRDLDSGLQYHRARWLAGGAGRWLSEDPVFDWPGNFGSAYAYGAASQFDGADVSGASFDSITKFMAVAILAFMATFLLAPLVGALSGLGKGIDTFLGGEGFDKGFIEGYNSGVWFWICSAWVFFTPAGPYFGAFLGGWGFASGMEASDESFREGKTAQGYYRYWMSWIGLCTALAPGLKNTPEMTFYHGTTSRSAASIRARGIDLSKSRPELDFGKGFYLSASKAHAREMAARAAEYARKTGTDLNAVPEVVEFRVPKNGIDGLKQLLFLSDGPEWKLFVWRNRRVGTPLHEYDVVAGPAAARYLVKDPSGVTSMPFPEFNQVSIHTEESAALFSKGIQQQSPK